MEDIQSLKRRKRRKEKIYKSEWVDGWMGGWVNGWMGGWVDGWMGGWVDGWMGEWVDGWMGGWVNGWMGGWVDGWMDEWVDGWTVTDYILDFPILYSILELMHQSFHQCTCKCHL